MAAGDRACDAVRVGAPEIDGKRLGRTALTLVA
jgi:hypothetical protein